MQILREKIVVQYHDIGGINFEKECEYFGGLPRIESHQWPAQNQEPGTHLLSIALHEPTDRFIGVAVFFHLDCAHENSYSIVKFSDRGFCEKPPNAMLMPQGRIVREALNSDTCLDYSFVSQTPIMRNGSYKGEAFLAQLTNDILPFPAESATFYIDLNLPPFWQI